MFYFSGASSIFFLFYGQFELPQKDTPPKVSDAVRYLEGPEEMPLVGSKRTTHVIRGSAKAMGKLPLQAIKNKQSISEYE